MGPRAARAGIALLALGVLLVAADALATTLLQGRVQRALSESLGAAVSVEARGWPESVRLLTAGVPEVRIRTAAPAAGARYQTVDLTLTDVHADLGTLVDQRPWSRLTAARADAVVTFPRGRGPLGLPQLRVIARGILATVGARVTTAAAAELTVDGRDDTGTASASARATDVALALPPRGTGDVRLVGSDARIRAGGAGLPLPVPWMEVVLQAPAVSIGTGGVQVTGRHAAVAAADLPVPGTAAVLRGFTAELPRMRAIRALAAEPAATTVTAAGGTYTTRLEESQANVLWELPGVVRFLDGTARLEVGEVHAAFTVTADGEALTLTPLLPPVLRPLFGTLPSLRVRPALPADLRITGARIRPGVLELSGTADRVVLPAPGSE